MGFSMKPLSQRGEIRLGFRCNARCGFCYYQELLDNPIENEPTTKELLECLNVLRKEGAKEVEFTGGEPTIRSDLATLVSHAKSIGFENISVITNGLRLSKLSYAENLVVAGVNDVLFSIHGADATTHDAHTKIPGSFSKIDKAFNNMQSLGVRCRATCTVTGKNFTQVDAILALFLGLRASCVHFAVFSPVAQADGSEDGLYVSYLDVAETLKRAIDKYETQLPPLSVKYIPFCFMHGYEKYVMNLYQQNYDPDDWNYYYSNKVRRARSAVKSIMFDAMSLIGFFAAKDWRMPLRHGLQGIKVYGFTRIVELIRKKRLKQCRRCRYDLVCDHIWREYAKRVKFSEIKEISGKKIRDPSWAYVMADYRSPGVRLTSVKSKTHRINVVQSEPHD
jgi:MoaA/NifB/PqqE/SkfB family radical SAM enzyme